MRSGEVLMGDSVQSCIVLNKEVAVVVLTNSPHLWPDKELF
jgi:hypothetical protein